MKQDRSQSIGGTDAPVIVLPKPRWGTRYHLWLEKTGRKLEEDISELPWIEWGLLLEDKIREKFTRDTGYDVQKPDKTFVHPRYPYITGNLDGLGVDEEGKRFVFEAKTSRFGTGWKDDKVPLEYQVQVAHYMMLADADYAFIAVLIGGSDYRCLKLLRDPELEQELLQKEVEFWEEHIVKDIAPEIETVEDLNENLTQEPGKEIQANEELERLAQEYLDADTLAKAYSERKDTVKLEICKRMGDAEVLQSSIAAFRYSKTSGVRLDTAKLKAELPHIYEKYSKPYQSYRFTKTLKED